MKYFEYGVVRFGGSGKDGNVFQRNTKTEDMESVMSKLSDRGNLGWEIYQVIEGPDGQTYFLMKREISKEHAKEMHMTKYNEDPVTGYVDIKKQGFVDGVGPDSETWK